MWALDRLLAISVLLGVALGAHTAGAQSGTLRGTVVRDTLATPISGAEVALPVLHRGTMTNDRGEFEMSDLPPGRHLLVVRRLGFAAWQDTVVLTAGELTNRTVHLRVAAATLDSVIITGVQGLRTISPLLRGFEERRHQGTGRFIAEAELRKEQGQPLGSVIGRRIPGLRQVYDGSASYLAASRSGSGAGPALLPGSKSGPCLISVYIDGALVYDAARMPGAKPPDFSRLETDTFAGVEFYAGGATVPPQYNATSAGCGTLLLWTRER